MELKHWNARRAGGRITVYGTDAATNGPAKIVGVDRIEPNGTGCIATDKDGTKHRLLLDVSASQPAA